MLTYLDILIRYSEQLIGKKQTRREYCIFMSTIRLLKVKNYSHWRKSEEAIYKEFKMKGLILSDPEVVRMMDRTMEHGNSKIISAGINKDGTLKAASKVASKDEFSDLRKYVGKVFEKTGNEIVEGNVDIAPYKMNDRTACTYCPFKSVCRFDATLKENNYRILPSLKPAEAMERVKGDVKS